jgi:pimeloyl-ACP methyl ester carboxylesterase
MAPQCAPSRAPSPLTQIPFVNDMLARGWVVTAPDYAGAGGTGLGEKYLVNAEQGRDLVNAVRAAQALPDTGAGNRFATYGESQGGEVALAGGALAPEYAPDLELVGIGGVAAASDAGAAIQHSWERPLVGWLLGPSIVRSWTRHYPNLDAAAILSDAGREHYAEVADNNCLLDILGVLVNPRMGAFFGIDPTSDPAWREAFVTNQAPLPPAEIPVFIGHGLDDPLIDPGYSARVVERYCAEGASVTTHWMEGVQHIASSVDAAPAYIDWLSNLLAGGEAPSNCGDALPVAPAPEME